MLMNESHVRNVIEAALLAAGKPLQPAELVELFDAGAQPPVKEIHAALEALAAQYADRGIEIKETAAGFRIQVRRELANEISRLWPERPARYSRALLETLALIAYRQPITRAEIEAVRGVAVNPNIIKTVIERNWVRVVGHRDVPGRPELLGTTREFLDYFGLKNLDELPPLAELKVLDDIQVQFELPDAGPMGLPGDSPLVTAGDPASKDAGADSAIADTSGEQRHSGGAAATDGHGAGDRHTNSWNVAADDAVGSPAANEGTEDEAAAGGSTQHQPSVATGSAVDNTSGKSGDSALHEAKKFAAGIDAELAAADDDTSDEDELAAAGPSSSGLVAGPRDWDP
jgi:segregation and condensation protein B